MRRFVLCGVHLLLVLLTAFGHLPHPAIAEDSSQKLKPSEMRPYNETIPGTRRFHVLDPLGNRLEFIGSDESHG